MHIDDLIQNADYSYGRMHPTRPRTRIRIADKGPFTPAPDDAPPIPIGNQLVTGYIRITGRRGLYVAARIIDDLGVPGEAIIVRTKDVVRPWSEELAAQRAFDDARRRAAEQAVIDNARARQILNRLSAHGIRHPTMHAHRQAIELTFDEAEYLLNVAEHAIPRTS